MTPNAVAIIASIQAAGFRPEFTASMLRQLEPGTFIGWSNDAGWGGDGWWFEGASLAEVRSAAEQEWAWDHTGEPPWEYVRLDELALMDHVEYVDLLTAWELNRGHATTETDLAVVRENIRRAK